jgi:hypothetical protein
MSATARLSGQQQVECAQTRRGDRIACCAESSGKGNVFVFLATHWQREGLCGVVGDGQVSALLFVMPCWSV